MMTVRRRLDSTVEQCSVEHCRIMVIFSPWLHYLCTVFILGYTSYAVHVFK